MSMHQWLVKRGRIGLTANESSMEIEIDTEGHDSCLLTALDTKEVSEIMTQYAQKIWEGLAEKEDYHQLYCQTDDGKYSWKNDSGLVVIGLDSSNEFLEIKYQGVNPCSVSINQAVEMIQILQGYISD